ncbi:MarR family transcriptional regulator [bacterium]|nr:MarR family transcriptional regulator [bacterium]
MRNLTRDFQKYMRDALGLELDLALWKDSKRLPHFLTDQYSFHLTTILELPVLVMEAKGDLARTPALIRKHLLRVMELSNFEVLFLDGQVTAYNRKRLVEQKIPFVIPGNQIYLPMLAIDFREYYRKLKNVISQFSPSTQTVILYILHNFDVQSLTPTKLAEKLDYSPMTLTRVFDEIETLEIATAIHQGRERLLQINSSKKEFWNNAMPYLCNPVKKRMWIHAKNFRWLKLRSGLSALAEYSMLNQPAKEVFALSMKEWRFHRQHEEIVEIPPQDPEATEIEIWSYAPEIFTSNSVVDPFSLFLSLQDESDERVQQAITEMMEKIQW